MISQPLVRSVETVHLSCVKISTVSKQIELLLEPRHLGEPLGVSKMIFEPMVYLVQIVHLSFTDTSTVSKRTKMIFHLTQITYEFHRVRLK
jgi:hypothetical protein